MDGRENFAMVLSTLSDARDHGSKRARPRGLRFVPNRGPAPRGPDEHLCVHALVMTAEKRAVKKGVVAPTAWLNDTGK